MLAQFVALPSDVQLAITALIGVLVALVLQYVIALVPWLAFLANYAQEWGLLLSAAFIDWLQNVLPTGSDDVSIKAILFVLAVIGMFVKFLKVRNVKGFAA